MMENGTVETLQQLELLTHTHRVNYMVRLGQKSKDDTSSENPIPKLSSGTRSLLSG